MSKTGLKVSTTKLVKIDLDAKTCTRYSGREPTHIFTFDKATDIVPGVIETLRLRPDTVGVDEQVAA